MRRLADMSMVAAAVCWAASVCCATAPRGVRDSVASDTVVLRLVLPEGDSVAGWRRVAIWRSAAGASYSADSLAAVRSEEDGSWELSVSLPAEWSGDSVRMVAVGDFAAYRGGCLLAGGGARSECRMARCADSMEVVPAESVSCRVSMWPHNGRAGTVALDGSGSSVLLRVRSSAGPVAAKLTPEPCDNGFDRPDSLGRPRCGLVERGCTWSAEGWECLFELRYGEGEVPGALLELTDTLAGFSCRYDVRTFGEVSMGGVEHVRELAIPPADYSGIVRVDPELYAVVNDKQDGFYIFTIPVDSTTGAIGQVVRRGFFGGGEMSRDCEDIAWYPPRRTLFVAGEGDQRILEYDPAAGKTGRELNVPELFRRGTSNYGFESLAYDYAGGLFWTATESTLPGDGDRGAYDKRVGNRLRLVAFDETLSPCAVYPYLTDTPVAVSAPANYAFGVSALAALPDGRLLVLEREFWVGRGLEVLASYVECRLYLVNPYLSRPLGADEQLSDLPADRFMDKKLLTRWRTDISAIANYEGLCLGPRLTDGSQTLLLVNDSQSGYAGVLREYVKLLTLRIE